MKKVFKIFLTVLILLAVAFSVYVLVAKPFKKVTFLSLSEMLCDAVGLETDDPAEELLKLGVVSQNIEARGNDKLTNEEAYSIISRTYLYVSEDDKPLGKIKDKDDISSAFKKDIAGLLKAGYLEPDGTIKPRAKAPEKKISELISSIRGTDITEEGSCHDETRVGNISVKSSGVTLSNTVFRGDIIVCDTPSASITLSKVTVKGRIIVRAAKNTSVKIIDGSEVTGGVYAVAAGGEASVECSEDVFCNVFANGKTNLSGSISTVTVLNNADVKARGDIGIVKTSGSGSITLERGSFSYVYARSPKATVRIEDGVVGESVVVEQGFAGSTITVAGRVGSVKCQSKNSVINIKGTAVLQSLEVFENSDKTNVLIEKRAKIENLSNAENSGAAVIDNRSQWDGRR